MSRRTKIIIVIIIILLILLAIFLFWLRFFRGAPQPATVVLTEQDAPAATTPALEPPIAAAPSTAPKAADEITLEALAKTFSERYGSYSNESNFANLRDLEPLITDRLNSEIETVIATTEIDDEVYRGITTRAISISVTELDEEQGTAVVSVMTQREEALGSPQNLTVYYQDLTLRLVKVSGAWKVDQAAWE